MLLSLLLALVVLGVETDFLKKSVALPDALLTRLVCDVFWSCCGYVIPCACASCKVTETHHKTTIFQHFLGGAA